MSATEKAVMFKTFETVEDTDGMINAQGVEILLQQEDDGVWLSSASYRTMKQATINCYLKAGV